MTEELRAKNEEIIKINTETVCNKIKQLLDSIPFSDLGYMRSQAAERLISESLVWGSFNEYEAVGICEMAKSQYISISEKINAEQEEDKINNK